MSNGNGIVNLDYWAAFHAQTVVKQSDDIDNTVTKTMGVLQEHGVYASFLYLLAKEGQNGKIVVKEMLDLLYRMGYNLEGRNISASVEDILQFVNEQVSCGSLERLLFAKETLEQMLVYARYGAKAKGKKTEQSPPDISLEKSDNSVIADTEKAS
jgi:hypothetical protein